ncbi:MAG: hypothetical protein H0A75_06910 [Candidatus Methanofishera endochildressiae]|uniref:DUF304 domain-containing protein n=1 Tax=Candidatus Methanofishera endochildressiae TaxID=2738884 RepID=A0A7Z0MPS5_9GAMM|nr:hypothetical protein [Candidatus Methanofishera endochildressiae]
MSKKSEPPLWIDVNQSPYLLSFIIVVHSIAIITCLMLPLNSPLIVLLLLLPGSSLYFYLQRYRCGFYTHSLKYSAEFSWELVEGEHFSSMRILKSSVLTSFIIILHTEIDNKRRNILVCRDAVSGDKYRQLFVALKIMKLE